MTDDRRQGRDRLERRTENWADREAGRFADHPGRTGLGWFVKLCLVLVVLSIVGGAIFGIGAWLGDWGGEARRVASPQNVREQHTEIIRHWQAMLNAAENACSASDSESGPGDPVLVEDPAFAYRATYRNARAEYNRRQHNLFEARLVGPKGYPRSVPNYEEVSKPKGDWCGVADKLRALQE